MNLGNLINRKIKESKYENKKEIYEEMKDIIGENCCAYNTFTEALNKNKNLSDVELLTLSTLLDLDLNKLALHYIKSQINVPENLSLEQYFIKNQKSILLYATYISNNKNKKDNGYILDIFDNKIYFILFSQNSNSVSCYEFDVKKGTNGYLFKTNQIADFNYFESILEECDLDINTFMEFDMNKKIEFLKKEGGIYFDLFPEKKQEISDVDLSEFENNIANEVAQFCFNLNENDIAINENDELYNSDGEKYESYFLENQIKHFAKNNTLDVNRLLELKNEIFEIFKKIALNKLSI